jgi:hypothetical protein
MSKIPSKMGVSQVYCYMGFHLVPDVEARTKNYSWVPIPNTLKHIYMARYLLSSEIAGFNQGNLAVQHNYIK